MPASRLGTEFIDGRLGPLHLTSFTPADTAPRGVVIVAQPLAEEANKCRRMVSLFARLAAERRWTVLVPDMYGSGDSAGDFVDADWQAWCDDLADLADRTGERLALAPVLLGIRQGALLAREALVRCPRCSRLLLWQPVSRGDQALTQFLRLRVAGNLGGGPKESVVQLKERVSRNQPVEVGGYALGAKLANGLESSALTPPERSPGQIWWFQVSNQDGSACPPAVERALAPWREAGWAVNFRMVAGDSFWATQEIAEAPRLVEATVEALEADCR